MQKNIFQDSMFDFLVIVKKFEILKLKMIFKNFEILKLKIILKLKFF